MTPLKFLNWVFTGKMITDIDIFHNGQYMTGTKRFVQIAMVRRDLPRRNATITESPLVMV